MLTRTCKHVHSHNETLHFHTPTNTYRRSCSYNPNSYNLLYNQPSQCCFQNCSVMSALELLSQILLREPRGRYASSSTPTGTMLSGLPEEEQISDFPITMAAYCNSQWRPVRSGKELNLQPSAVKTHTRARSQKPQVMTQSVFTLCLYVSVVKEHSLGAFVHGSFCNANIPLILLGKLRPRLHICMLSESYRRTTSFQMNCI